MDDKFLQNRRASLQRFPNSAEVSDDSLSNGFERPNFQRSHTAIFDYDSNINVDDLIRKKNGWHRDDVTHNGENSIDRQEKINKAKTCNDRETENALRKITPNKNSKPMFTRAHKRSASLGNRQMFTSNQVEEYKLLANFNVYKETLIEKPEVENLEQEYQLKAQIFELKRHERELNITLDNTKAQLLHNKKRVKELNDAINGKIEDGLNLIDENGVEKILVLKTNHDTLVNDVKKYKQELKTMKTREDNLGKENALIVSQLNTSIAERNFEREESENTIKRLKEEVGRLTKNVTEENNEKMKVESEFEEFKKIHKILEDTSEKTLVEFKKMKIEYENQVAKLQDDVKIGNEKRIEDTTNLGKIIADSEINISKLTMENQKLLDDAQVLKDVIYTMEQSVGDLTTEKESVEQKLKEITQKYVEHKKQVMENEELYREEKKLIFQKAKKFESLLHECDEALSLTEKKCDEVQRLYGGELKKNEELQEKLQQLTQLMTVGDETIVNLKNDLKMSESSLQDTRCKHAAVKLEKEANEKHVSELKNENEVLKEDFRKCIEASKSLKEIYNIKLEDFEEKLKEKIKTLEEKQVNFFEASKCKSRSECNTIKETYESKIKGLQENARETEDRLKKEIKKLTEKHEMLSTDRNDKSKEIKRLKLEIKRLTSQEKHMWKF